MDLSKEQQGFYQSARERCRQEVDEMNRTIRVEWQHLNDEIKRVQELIQTLETRNFTLANGVPAIQRIFQWKQLKLDQTIMIGSYILFLSQGGYVEFHTDYTSAEWELMKPLIEQVVTSMESTP